MVDDNTELTIAGFGKSVTIKGVFAIFIIAISTVSVFLGWLLYSITKSSEVAMAISHADQDQRAQEHRELKNIVTAISAEHVYISEAIQKVDSSLKVQNYILLSDQKEREAIKRRLTLPKELREIGVREP